MSAHADRAPTPTMSASQGANPRSISTPPLGGRRAGGGGRRPVRGGANSILVALAILCSALPLRSLFDGQSWLWRLAMVLAVVGLTGALTRSRWSMPRVLLAQGAAYLAALVVLFHGNTLALGVLPTPRTVLLWHGLLVEVGQTLSEHAAPAPQTAGVVFLLTGAIGAIGWAADVLAVTLRRPALAGMAILAPFLTAVANSDGGLHPGYFAATAGCWLALLAVSDFSAVLSWGGNRDGTRGPSEPSGGGHPRVAGAGGRAGATGVLAASAVALALVVAAALPHLPVRYLADGFGTGGLGGRGQVGFSPSAQMLADLRNTAGRPILHYRTDDPTPPPLRVVVASEYASGAWSPQEDTDSPSASPQLRYPLGWQQGTATARQHRMQVEQNRLVAPYLAAPPDVIEGRVYDAQWVQGRTTGVLRVDEQPSRYEVTYLDVEPDPETLQQGAPGTYPRSVQEALDSSPVTPLVAQRAREVTARTDGAYGQAIAIQDWLRSSGGFTYSLELAPPPPGMSRQETEARAVDLFLQSRRGYCVQFSTAMVLMARSLGIPARTATGFLPGSLVDGVREVEPADAHAWPELYFDGVGWLRFEPTPGSRSGAPPEYTVARLNEAGATASPNPRQQAPTPTPTGPAPQAQRPDQDIDLGPQAVDAQDGGGWWRVAAPLLLLALVCVVPSAAARSRRARAGSAAEPADRVELCWQDLLERLDDLGIEVDPAQTLPEQRAAIHTAAALRGEPDEALARLADTVLTARYAPPDALAPNVANRAELQADRVRRDVARARGPVQRARALLWPGAGVAAIAQALGSPARIGRRAGASEDGSGGADAATDAEFTGRPAQPVSTGGRGAGRRGGTRRPGSGSGPG